MDAYELMKEEQHARALNLRDYANQPGEHQTVKSADRERSVPADPHSPATTSSSSSSSSRRRHRSLAPSPESQSTRGTNTRAAESFSGEPELNCFDLDLKHKLEAYLAKEISDSEEDPSKENPQAYPAKEILDSDEDPPKKNLQPDLVKEIPDIDENPVDDSDLELPKVSLP